MRWVRKSFYVLVQHQVNELSMIPTIFKRIVFADQGHKYPISCICVLLLPSITKPISLNLACKNTLPLSANSCAMLF